MTKQLSVLAVAVAAAAWVAVSAQQEMLPRPGPGSGVTPVRIVNEAAVTVSGTSDVRVTAPVAASVRVPSFATKGRTLVVVWATGDDESVTVNEVLEDGWVAVDGNRFVNLSSARSVRIVR